MRAWPIIVGLLAGAVAMLYGHDAGQSTLEGFGRAARYTGIAGLIMFLIPYSASSLARLAPGPVSLMLLRDRRWWGLGYAAAMLVHAYAISQYIAVDPYPARPEVELGGGIGFLVIALLALTSNRAAVRWLGPAWRRLHSFGIHWLWGTYLVIFASRVLSPANLHNGIFGLVLVQGALALRIAARRRPPPPIELVS